MKYITTMGSAERKERLREINRRGKERTMIICECVRGRKTKEERETCTWVKNQKEDRRWIAGIMTNCYRFREKKGKREKKSYTRECV